MKKIAGIVFLAGCMFLSACASGPSGGGKGDLFTNADQTDNQRRAQIRLQLAVSYYEQRQIAVALDEIKQAIQADPNFADAYSVRALIYMEMGETRFAEENFLHALKLSPNNPDFHNNYGWFLCQNERATQSFKHFETAINNRAYQSPAKALHNAGVCSLRIKDVAAAERYLTEAFRQDPSNLSTSANLAKVKYDKREYEQARFYIARITRSEAVSADALWLGVRIERKLGDRPAENSLATQLRRRFPNSAEFAAYQRGAFDE